jgi:phosphoribosyl 1,2-cyclic phosphodiesterase
MRFTVLGSGSTGNAVLISTGTTNVLVDAGLSAREILRRLAVVGLRADDLDGILITHEHSDHAGGLRVLLASVKCPVYVSEVTEDAYYQTRKGVNGNGDECGKRRAVLKDRTVAIESNADFSIGDIDFEPFQVPHDAVDNFGFVARRNGCRVATLMDFGCVTPLIKEKLKGCDAIVIESNHSRDMLRTCPVYTWDLKRRIAGQWGHLSNEDLADFLINDFDGSSRDIVLAHISQRANEPHLARLTAETALRMRAPLFAAQTTVHISRHNEPTQWFEY